MRQYQQLNDMLDRFLAQYQLPGGIVNSNHSTNTTDTHITNINNNNTNTTINTNTTNTTNTTNNTTTNNYHITINPFGKENWNYMTDSMMLKMNTANDLRLSRYVQLVHFNLDHPENHNVRYFAARDALPTHAGNTAPQAESSSAEPFAASTDDMADMWDGQEWQKRPVNKIAGYISDRILQKMVAHKYANRRKYDFTFSRMFDDFRIHCGTKYYTPEILKSLADHTPAVHGPKCTTNGHTQ
jgi:hypothetical protein